MLISIVNILTCQSGGKVGLKIKYLVRCDMSDIWLPISWLELVSQHRELLEVETFINPRHQKTVIELKDISNIWIASIWLNTSGSFTPAEHYMLDCILITLMKTMTIFKYKFMQVKSTYRT